MSEASYALAVSATVPQISPGDRAEHPDLRALLDCWRRMRGPDAMPARACAMKEIGRLLKFVHLSDVIDAGRNFRFHLLGVAVFEGLAENQTGRLVGDHPDMGVRLRFPILMGEAVRTKAPVRGLAIRQTENGVSQAESIWLPFGDCEVRQIMGMSVFTAR
jgi:hypothetical protein